MKRTKYHHWDIAQGSEAFSASGPVQEFRPEGQLVSAFSQEFRSYESGRALSWKRNLKSNPMRTQTNEVEPCQMAKQTHSGKNPKASMMTISTTK